jgi:uncharacterized membrane protein
MTAPQLPPEPPPSESIVELGRVGGLSDAVYAVAFTILVLEIRLPENVLVGDLAASLRELAPKLLVYLISFVIIGGAWGSHQRMLGQIRRGDGLLVWFNLFSLLFVTLVPASAALLGRFPNSFIAIVCFAVDVIFIQLSAWLLWHHASKHDLINPTLDPRVVGGIGRRLSLSGIIFALSIPLALINANLVYFIWIGLFILFFTTDWLSWQQAFKTEDATIPLDGATRAHVHVVHGAGHLRIQASANSENLARGTFGGGLDAQVKREDDTVDLQMRPEEKPRFMSWRFPWAWSLANTLDWTIDLIRELPITLEVETGGGQADLDLSDLLVTELNLKTSASSMTVLLPAHATHTSGNIEASVASLTLHLPPGVAALIRTNKALSSLEVGPNRFIVSSDGHQYQTVDYEAAVHRVDLQISLSLGSVKVI